MAWLTISSSQPGVLEVQDSDLGILASKPIKVFNCRALTGVVIDDEDLVIRVCGFLTYAL
jgi:hypothetical protein